jgi:hypothetical protein
MIYRYESEASRFWIIYFFNKISINLIFLQNKYLKMNSKYLNVRLLIVLFYLFGSYCYAQQSIVGSGGEVNGSGGTVSYSLGQVAYVSGSGSGGFVYQGVQQPYQISVVETRENELKVSLVVFPNPVSSNLILESKNHEGKNLSYQLYDLEGKLLDSKIITSNQTSVNTNNLLPAEYLLHITSNNVVVKNFKIIKK